MLIQVVSMVTCGLMEHRKCIVAGKMTVTDRVVTKTGNVFAFEEILTDIHGILHRVSMHLSIFANQVNVALQTKTLNFQEKNLFTKNCELKVEH